MFVTLSLVFALACLLPAFGKLSAHPRMRAAADHFGIAWERYQLIGVAELAAAAGVLAGLYWRPVGLAAGAGMAVLLLGAVFTHLRASDSPREALPALVLLALDALYLATTLVVPR